MKKPQRINVIIKGELLKRIYEKAYAEGFGVLELHEFTRILLKKQLKIP